MDESGDAVFKSEWQAKVTVGLAAGCWEVQVEKIVRHRPKKVMHQQRRWRRDPVTCAALSALVVPSGCALAMLAGGHNDHDFTLTQHAPLPHFYCSVACCHYEMPAGGASHPGFVEGHGACKRR